MPRLSHILSLIKFSHTLFALPFALSSMLVAAHGFPPLKTFILILLCMVTARTAAMSFNRYLDADLDAANPRTQSREIPKGIVTRRFALRLSIYSAVLFAIAAGSINTRCMMLAPLVLFLLFFYSYTKRFTDFSHLVLGLCLGIAPVAAWVAVRDKLALEPIVLGLGVAFWVAGFDIIYATQDLEFDKKARLHSLVVRIGIGNALLAARILHLLTLALFFWFGELTHLGWSYFLTLTGCGLLLFYEHRLVKPTDLSKVNAAFFTMNGYISMLFLAGITISVF